MSSITQPANLVSPLQIPYPEWNRPHLRRRVSDPHRSHATARGHRYTVSERNAIETLRLFTGSSRAVLSSPLTRGVDIRLVVRQLPPLCRTGIKYIPQVTPVVAADNSSLFTFIPDQDDYREPSFDRQQTLPNGSPNGLTSSHVLGSDVGSLASIALSIPTESDRSESLHRSNLRQKPLTDDDDQVLTCRRCPLILPDMTQYWGLVSTDSNG